MGSRECFVCNTNASWQTVANKIMFHVSCPVCGDYQIGRKTAYYTTPHSLYRHPKRYLLSAVIRRYKARGFPPPLISSETLPELLASHQEPRITEKLDLTLQYLVDNTPAVGQAAKYDPVHDYPLAFAKDPGEFEAFIRALRQMGKVEGVAKGSLLVTIKGLEHADNLARIRPGAGNRCFVAMWFDKGMRDAYHLGFCEAIRAAGYEPVRVDEVEHNNKIDDQILVEIRRSRLVVADLTGHRGGVYFEAGFAMGLGIPVIWTCRDDEAEKTHFDVAHFNQIRWSSIQELRKRLEDRILATVPTSTLLPVSNR